MTLTRVNTSESKQQGRAPRRQRPALELVSRGAGIALVLAVPLASVTYAAPLPAPSGDAGAGTAGVTVRVADPSALYAQRTPPVPLEDNGVAPLPGGSNAPNTARPPSASTPAAPGIPPNPYADVRWKGIVVNLPQASNTVDLGLGGFRQKLRDDYGIGYFGLSQTTFFSNVLNHAQRIGGQQVYVGQKPTVLSSNFLALIFDLSRYGIPDGQIVVVGSDQATSWNPLGPNSINLGTLSYYQTLFNKRLEIKAGLLATNTEFVGTFIGGSLNGGVFGPNGSIFGENGFGALGYPQPGINITGHITANIYDKIGVERALNPDGVVLEHNYNPTSVSRFYTPNTGPMVINELGYLRPATPGSVQTWVRGGAILDKSRFNELDHPRRRSNNQYGLYLLGDRQLVQTSSAPGEAYRGLYAGFSAEYAPPNYDRFSQYYEARLYGLGLLPGRPLDQVSLVFTENVFSNIAVNNFRALRLATHKDSKALTISYSAQVIHGVYANLGAQYVNNPSPIVYTGNTGSALNIIAGASLYF